VEEGKQRQPGPQVLKFGLEWFLHLAHQVGALPQLAGLVRQFGSGGGVVLVGDGGARPRSRLDEHRHALLVQLAHSIRGDRHPKLVGLDLGGNTYGRHGP